MEQILATAQSIGVAIAQILLAIYFCKQYIDKYQKEHLTDVPKAIVEQNKIDMEIINRMDYYKELLDADRILLFEFHNGQHYSSYRSALRMSASYEVYRAGLDNSRDKCSNIPVSIMPKFISEITTDGICYCHNIEELRDRMGNAYEFKKALGIQSFYDVAIKDTEDNIIGFVAVQWNKPMEEFNELEINHLAWFMEEVVKKLTSMDKQTKKKKLFTKAH